ETKLLQAADDDSFRVVNALRVVQDDSVARGQSPRRTRRRAHPIEVVESLFRLEVCARPIRVHPWGWSVRPSKRVQRGDTDGGDEAVEIRRIVAAPSGVLASRTMAFDRIRRGPHCLRIGSAREGPDSKRAHHIPSRDTHDVLSSNFALFRAGSACLLRSKLG